MRSIDAHGGGSAEAGAHHEGAAEDALLPLGRGKVVDAVGGVVAAVEAEVNEVVVGLLEADENRTVDDNSIFQHITLVAVEAVEQRRVSRSRPARR